MVYQMGFTLSTLYGVYVSDLVGFRRCCDFVGFACIGVGLLYLISTTEMPRKSKKEEAN
jgi:hypothetical protein